MQNLRARAYDPANGRFIGLDPFAGNMQDPQSLHKYAYVHGDPITGIDPSGREFTIGGLMSSMAIGGAINVGIGIGVKVAFDRTEEITAKSILYDFALGVLFNGGIYGLRFGWASLQAIRAGRAGNTVVGTGAAAATSQAALAMPQWMRSLPVLRQTFTHGGQIVNAGRNFIGTADELASVMKWLDESHELFRLHSAGSVASGKVVQSTSNLISTEAGVLTTGITNSARRTITLSAKAPLSTAVEEMVHFRYLLSKNLWGKQVTRATEEIMESNADTLLRHFGFDVPVNFAKFFTPIP